jgi:hypothetical protein
MSIGPAGGVAHGGEELQRVLDRLAGDGDDDVTLLQARRPRRAAGRPGSSQVLSKAAGTQAETVLIPGDFSTALPIASELSSTSRIAMMKWTVEPAASTTTRCWRAAPEGAVLVARAGPPPAGSSRRS